MLIEELARRESDSATGTMAGALHGFAKAVAEDAKQHAKRILSQLPGFDLHDEVHLAAVLRNLEQVIGNDNARKLSIYELFFLYAASHLHDVGMALADWELNAITAVEAEDVCRGSSSSGECWHRDFSTNGGRPLSVPAARERVSRHSKSLYQDFAVVVDWSFAPDSEDQLVDYLAQTIVDYQRFRSGFTRTLQGVAGDELCRYVRSLRIDFLRSTHHVRSHYYIKNLARSMPKGIPQPWRKVLSRDLADICRAHGEETSLVEKLKSDAQYIGPDTANLQFVASLLRVADIVHFSLDRAPAVLSSEMQFRNEESFVHWAVKQQGVTYDIQESGVGGTKTVKFKAYCTNPRYYYELHRYLDGVDHELANFGRMSRRWDQAFGKQVSDRWSIPLADEVDRSGIRHDSDKFVPVRGLSFSLEQKRILELLMGVRLYKDKHACLRELYQNSLDACKCMIALSDGREEGRIEFWLEQRNADNDVYLCCLDNGIGMTKDIIVRHLLRIGNSYYTSPAFERLRTSHERIAFYRIVAQPWLYNSGLMGIVESEASFG